MPPVVRNNPLQRALMTRSENPSIPTYSTRYLDSRVAFSPLAYNPTRRAYMPPLSPVKPTRNQSRRNLLNSNSRGQLTKTMPYIPKQVGFSNGSRPGNNINPNLPKSVISGTSNRTLGSYVVPPTAIGNTYAMDNYNRSYGRLKKSRKNRKSRKTRRKNYN